MKEINKIAKAYAKMVVANVDNNDLKEEHFLLVSSHLPLNDAYNEIINTNNWARNLYKQFGIDTDNDEVVMDTVANLIQNNIDKMLES